MLLAMSVGERDRDGWRGLVWELAAFARPSASEGERRAAELIAARLRKRGCEATVERELAHGGYWHPIALANAIALGASALAARGGRTRRGLAALAAGTAAAALWDDLGHGRRWFRRALLPRRATWNVLAQAGDRDGERTVAFVAHHDAAHSGLVFHPALGRLGPRLLRERHERSSHTLPILRAVWLGPAAICAGSLLGARAPLPAGRRATLPAGHRATLPAGRALLGAGARAALALGRAFALGTIAAMLDVSLREVVPGANDNLAAVGALAALAERLDARGAAGVRVLLISTGSEESFSEGMQALVERHRDELDPASTEFVCLECLGGSTLIVLEGEGMLRMRDYPREQRESLARAAEGAGVAIARGLRTVGATDALIALRAGYRAVTLASVEATKLPLNYHWPSDVPEHLHWDTVERAIAVCEAYVRNRAAAPAATAAPASTPPAS